MVLLTTVFLMMFLVNLISGNMIGRYDGVRGNSNCMVYLPRFLGVLFFLSKRKIYNFWSCLSQFAVYLCLFLSIVLHLLDSVVIRDNYRPILISFVVIVSALYLALFIDVMMYDHKHHNRF